jgi:hypothetical protein
LLVEKARRVTHSEIDVLVITGSMGAGKTTLMVEASDLLTGQGVRHAAIDLDALGIALLPPRPATAEDERSEAGMSGALERVMYLNLRDVWANYRAAGVNRLLLARAVEHGELPLLKQTIGDAHIAICRIRAPLATMEARVRLRERGIFQDTFVRRVAELDGLLDRAALEDFAVTNDGNRSITEVASEILQRAGWI